MRYFLLILMGMRCTIYEFCIYLCELWSISFSSYIFIILLFICEVFFFFLRECKVSIWARIVYDNDNERKKWNKKRECVFLCRWSIFCSNIFSNTYIFCFFFQIYYAMLFFFVWLDMVNSNKDAPFNTKFLFHVQLKTKWQTGKYLPFSMPLSLMYWLLILMSKR